MKKTVVCMLAVLVSALAAQASIVTVFEDNFDLYADQNDLLSVWSGTAKVTNTNGGLALSSAQSYSPTQALYQSTEATPRKSATGITPSTGTDANPLVYSFRFLDITGTGNLRQFGTLQDYDPASAQLLAIGAYNAATDRRTGLAATATQLNTYYSARITFGTGAPAWFILNGDGAPTRSPGWRELSIVVTDTKVDFRVDGVSAVQGIAPVQNFNLVPGLTFDHITLGSGLSSANGGAYYDDAKVQILPEPVSLALLGLGCLFLRRRRA